MRHRRRTTKARTPDIKLPEPTPGTTAALAPRVEISPYIELGRTGLKRTGGYLQEEFKRELQGQRGMREYRVMLDNCAIANASFGAIKRTARRAKREVEPYSEGNEATTEDQQNADFVKECLDDMSNSFEDVLSEILTMGPYGYAPMEIVYKTREGFQRDPTKRSRFTDGRIGWRKWALRGQDTVTEWVFDASDGVEALVQEPPPTYQRIVIPIEKLLLFRMDATKGNPEGMSIFRAAYFEWYGLRRLLELSWIAAERDLRGVPVATIPADNMRSDATAAQSAVLTAVREIVENLKNDEQASVVLPQAFDPETKQPLFTLSLLSAPGQGEKIKGFLELINRHELRIAMLTMTDWILMGHGEVGAKAVASPRMEMFAQAMNTMLGAVAEVVNRHAIPRLFALNGLPLDRLPKLKFGELESKDLAAIAEFLKALAGSGADVFPDEKLLRSFYSSANWPTDGRDDLAKDDLLQTREKLEEEKETQLEMQQQALDAKTQGKGDPEDDDKEPPPTKKSAVETKAALEAVAKIKALVTAGPE